MPRPSERTLSALPSPRARLLAFFAILLAGVCGAAIGSSFVSLQCQGACTTAAGLGGLAGGVIAAAGVAVVSVLVLRAMGEWNRLREEELAGAPTTGSDGEGESPPPALT